MSRHLKFQNSEIQTSNNFKILKHLKKLKIQKKKIVKDINAFFVFFEILKHQITIIQKQKNLKILKLQN